MEMHPLPLVEIKFTTQLVMLVELALSFKVFGRNFMNGIFLDAGAD